MTQNKEYIKGTELINQADFEDLYIEVRKTENRVYTNEQVKLLPDINQSNQHFNEWKIRKQSINRLIKYIRAKNRPLRILEIGCGNGWLSNKLAEIDQTKVTGLDLNATELNQAIEVFGNKENLNFFYGTITDIALKSLSFDLIIFAASIQYFPSVSNIISFALSILNKDGEVHIIDSHFYMENEIKSAKYRSETYFKRIGFEQMSQFYFHHRLNDLNCFNYKIKYNPKSFLNQLLKNKMFYWICIKN